MISSQPHISSKPAVVALEMLASWMGARFFRTFQHSANIPDPFDAILTQRDRRVGVTVGELWEDGNLTGRQEMENLVGADIEQPEQGYVLWVPPGASIPTDEPRFSEFRLLISAGLKGLAVGERRELRVPTRLRLAKVDDSGSYVSVSGGMSQLWTNLSDGVQGAFHLDSSGICRLPEEEAEVDILVSRVRDRAASLNVEELSEIAVHDYWLVSRLPADEPTGLTISGSPPDFDPTDGSITRRLLRRHVRRARDQREDTECDLAVLLLLTSVAHIEDETVTMAVRGMNPDTYRLLDMIVLVGDGQVREILQPRSLPWEN